MTDIPTKDELIAEIRREWLLLETLLNSLSEDQMTTPDVEGPWSVKDMLAHLSAWEKVLLDRLGAALSGGTAQYPPILSEDDVHRFNAQAYTDNQDRTLSAVLQEFRSLYTGVLTVVEALPDPSHAPGLSPGQPDRLADHPRQHQRPLPGAPPGDRSLAERSAASRVT